MTDKRSNKFPDQEGIKTIAAARFAPGGEVPTNSLTKKGLRHASGRRRFGLVLFQQIP